MVDQTRPAPPAAPVSDSRSPFFTNGIGGIDRLDGATLGVKSPAPAVGSGLGVDRATGSPDAGAPSDTTIGRREGNAPSGGGGIGATPERSDGLSPWAMGSGPETLRDACGGTGGGPFGAVNGTGGGTGDRFSLTVCHSSGAPARVTRPKPLYAPALLRFCTPALVHLMSLRELLALGTASQVPTRHRNHNGYFLRWDDEGFLFDPGEGTQRQMAYGELAASSITRIFVTHFHGDHCLGLAGIVQRLSLDRVPHPVTVYYPASGEVFFQRLRHASIYHAAVDLRPRALDDARDALVCIDETETLRFWAHPLRHSVPTLGYRVEEKATRKMLPERLAAHGIAGPRIGELQRAGSLAAGDTVVTLDDVSVARPGSAFAFVMDTRACPGAVALARDADLLLMEATYTAEDQHLADAHDHASSADAARTALEAGAHRLAMAHFSQRYLSLEQHLAEARALFAETVALRDLDRVTIPRRRA